MALEVFKLAGCVCTRSVMTRGEGSRARETGHHHFVRHVETITTDFISVQRNQNPIGRLIGRKKQKSALRGACLLVSWRRL